MLLFESLMTKTVNIVQNNLILYLDANISGSYPGTGTTWTDLTGNGRNGTLTNGPTFSSANGGSIVFDGSNDYVSVNYTQTNALTYTVEVWAKGGLQGICQNRGSGAGVSLSLGLTGFFGGGGPNADSGYLFFVVDTDNIGRGPYHTGKKFNDGAWHQLVGTLNIPNATQLDENTHLKLFADGQALASSATWGAGSLPTSPFTGLGNLRIGNHEAWGQFFNGNIAIVRIYNIALSAIQVQQNFNATRGRFNI